MFLVQATDVAEEPGKLKLILDFSLIKRFVDYLTS
jgi:hypothetical protein